MAINFEESQTVAFLGPPSSYTHQATLSLLPDASKHKLTAQTTIEDVFASVQNAKASIGVVPFENSSNGPVAFTLDLFASQRYSDVVVVGETYLRVRHCLVGQPSTKSAGSDSVPKRHLEGTTSGTATPTQSAPQPQKPRSRPDHDLSHITKLYSHPQAWDQCKVFLSTYLKNVERQDVSSTSKAAELVAQDPSRTTAAVSSRLAAEINGLNVLAEGIQDSAGNSTRFFVLQRRDSTESPLYPPSLSALTGPADERTHEYKSLLTFTVHHSSPGSLADCLSVFKRRGLNLTSINSRPSGDAPWHYIFFVEFLGRREEKGEGGDVNVALRELEGVARGWRWVGSWRSSTYSRLQTPM